MKSHFHVNKNLGGVLIVATFLMIVSVASASSTIGTDITTGGALNVTGAASLSSTLLVGSSNAASSFSTWPSTATRSNFDVGVGMRFTVNQSITVSKLGRLYVAGNTQDHGIRMWVSSDTSHTIASTTILAASASDSNGFKWSSITPITLTPGNTYAIAIQETNGGDTWKDTWAASSAINSAYIGSITEAFLAGLSGGYPSSGVTVGNMYDTLAMYFTVGAQPPKVLVVGSDTSQNTTSLSVTDSNLSPIFTAINSGNVGIGTSSPWRSLSVNGSSDLGVNAMAQYFTASSNAVPSTFNSLYASSLNSTGSTDGSLTLSSSAGAATISLSGANLGSISVGGMASTSNLNLPQTASSSYGLITVNGNPFIHTYGTQNTFIGGSGSNERSGNFTLTGNNNVGLGRDTLYYLTSGYQNMAIGGTSLIAVTSGYNNVAIGYGTLTHITTGFENLGFGYNSLAAETDAKWDIAVGAASLQATDGTGDVGVGRASGASMTSGDNDIFIGTNAGFSSSQLVSAANSIAIGANTYTTASNQMILGGTGISTTGIGTTTPKAAFVVGSGDIFVGTTTGSVSGVILEASDATCHKLVISTSNVISASTVTCPF